MSTRESELVKKVLEVVENMKMAASNRRNVGERSTANHLAKWASKVESAVRSAK